MTRPLPTVQVGDAVLPELPLGWKVAVDTEGAGLYPDGDPIPSGSRPAAPPAHMSVVSVSFRWPMWDDKTSGWAPGPIVDYAWPFDQGPLVGKPGKPVKDPETGVCTFDPITQEQQDKVLAKFAKFYGMNDLTMDEAAPNLSVDEYAKLIGWLDRRDYLIMHHAKHDQHVFRLGMRKGAGGDPDVPHRLYAWDTDSERGQWSAVFGERWWKQATGFLAPRHQHLHGGYEDRRIWCTQIVQKQLIDPLELAALKSTAKRLWGEEEGDEQAKLTAELKQLVAIGPGMHKRYDLLPWCGAMGRYAAKDTNLTLRLHEYQVDVAEEGAVLDRFWELCEEELQLNTVLYRMERRGVAYDVEASLAEGERMRQLCRDLAAKMPFNPSKVNEAKRFYFDPVEEGGLGLEPLGRTPTGLPQLDIQGVAKLAEEGQPWARELALWTKWRNSDSKWYTGYAARTGEDGRIRTSFKQCKMDKERPGQAEGGTKSGRLAVGRWQAQAIPHKELVPEGSVPPRKLIGQEQDYELYEHDLPSGEVRVITVIANSTKMWDMLDNGLDLHGHNTKLLYGIDETDPDFKHLRSGVKRGTFGFIYNGGVMAVKEQVEAAAGRKMSLASIKKMKEDLFEEYPEFRLMGQQAEQKVNRWVGGCGYLTMLDGWRRWYAHGEKTNSAVNQVIQCNLARAMNKWMIAVEREVPGCLLLQVHDSLITRHLKGAHGYAEALKVSAIGEREFQKYFGIRGRVMRFGIAPERWNEKS